ncbi:sensor histidine kinase [Pedobacter sp. BS3]|uniref:ATP-binding protein n=1 Tax=Pedobacter sp. BS3 TaxID=2567937 RepID=UPI0016591731|nr:sensor histidine kinase [Pedobacter sp. BS3]
MILISGILLYSSLAAGQSLDSLNHELQQARTVNAKIHAYEDLIRYYQSVDPQKAFDMAKALMALSQKNNNAEGKAIAYYNYGIYWLLQGQYDSVKHYAALTGKTATSGKVERVHAMGINLMAIYFWNTGKLDSSLRYHLSALRIREKNRDTNGLGISYLGLGSLYATLQKTKDAEEYLIKGWKIGEKTKNDKLIINCMHMLANVYASREQYSKALQVDEKAIKVALKANDKRGVSQIYSNMANCYTELGQYDKSIIYHYKVLEIDKFFKDDRQIADTYFNLATCYQKTGNNQKAIDLASQAVALFKKTGYKEGLNYTLPLLSRSYEDTGNYRQALKAQQDYVQVQKEIFNETSDKTISDLKTQYETEKKEQQIKSLNQKNLIQQLQIRQKNISLIIAGILLIFIISIAYFIYNRRKLKARAVLQEAINKEQEMAARGILDAEERERRRIAGDLHDGVGQMLSAALMNLNSLFQKLGLNTEERYKAEQSLALVTESYDEMRSISHQMMPNALIKAGLASAVKEFINKIDKDKIRVSLETIGLNGRLDEQVETVLFRVIQETVNNVIKHAEADKLHIQLLKDEEGVTVTIEDNGKGFDKSKIKSKTGIGLSNIYSRVGFLKGTVDIDTAPGKGTLINIFVPA